MSNRIDTKIVLGSYRYKTAIDTDLLINVPLQGNQREFDEFDRNGTISLAQVFDDERQASTIFRPTAEIDFIFSNAYSGTTGILGADYTPFTNYMYYVNSSSSFATGLWSGYPQYYEFDFFRPKTEYDNFQYCSESAYTYNWMNYLSYGYENNYDKKLSYTLNNSSYNWIASEGIPFTIVNGTENGSRVIRFQCVAPHGLSVGEYVELSFFYNQVNLFQVYSLGDGSFESDPHIFNIFNYALKSGNCSNCILTIAAKDKCMDRAFV